jgi:hypothetical protein
MSIGPWYIIVSFRTAKEIKHRIEVLTTNPSRPEKLLLSDPCEVRSLSDETLIF